MILRISGGNARNGVNSVQALRHSPTRISWPELEKMIPRRVSQCHYVPFGPRSLSLPQRIVPVSGGAGPYRGGRASNEQATAPGRVAAPGRRRVTRVPVVEITGMDGDVLQVAFSGYTRLIPPCPAVRPRSPGHPRSASRISSLQQHAKHGGLV
jgi:hypothetical protein